MKKLILIVSLVLFAFTSFSKEVLKDADKQEILSLLDKQVEAWNNGNLENFMQTYWNNEKLVFVGSRGPTYGWQATLESYKKGYPDKKAMGKLKFNVLDISKIDKHSVFIIGRFDLAREDGDLAGYFTLVVQKKNGQWKIISDHSSSES